MLGSAVKKLAPKKKGCVASGFVAVGLLVTGACVLSEQAKAALCSECYEESISGQLAAQTSNVTVINNGQQNTVSARRHQFHGGQPDDSLKFSGILLKNEQGSQIGQLNKGAAGDDNVLMDKLGVYLNGSVGFGDRKTTGTTLGFDTDRQESTLGADYKLTDHFLIGTVFNFSYTKNALVYGVGDVDSNRYVGSVYGSFFTDSGFFVDGIFSGASIDYNAHTNTNAIQARGSNQGTEFDVSMTTGYNYSAGGLTLTPQVRVEHISLQLSALDEFGAGGLLVHANERDLESLKTGTGAQISYAFSFPWGVLVPTLRAEWVHEFQNGSKAVLTRIFNQSSVRLSTRPDRDFSNLGAGFSAQFAHGISAFANYENLQGHTFLTHHTFTGGIRFEF